MQVEQNLWTANKGWSKKTDNLSDANLVIYFGGKNTLNSGERYAELKSFYPQAHIMGCSTGGEVFNDEVVDDSVVVSAIKFDKTQLKVASQDIVENKQSRDAGVKIAQALNASNLKNIFILSDGTKVNGSDLVAGLYGILDKNVIVTGGLAGDAADFGTTYVGVDEAPKPGKIVAVGFYGDAIKIGYGSVGGWDTFGPERKITRSKDNILYELDGKPALDLYKEYLGEEAQKLPGSALLFPLNIRPEQGSKNEIVRTIVGIDENEKSMIFAGDIPEGHIAQLMHGDFNHLVEGAADAAKLAGENKDKNASALAILVSCIGRKLLLGQGISDETEAVADVFANKVPTIGFYSYGEICHQQFTGECSLHNQTMTVSVLYES